MPDPVSAKRQLLLHDVILIGIMAILAACGLIYEYLLSHYAGRVLGAVETAIYAMIGIMIVSMGLGAFAARWCKQPFTAFAWLEAIIALVGMSAVLLIAALIALTGTLPQLLTEIFNLPPGTVLDGEILLDLQEFATYTPYFAGFLLGFLIGMEIPLIARVRQQIYGTYLENNIGTIYGADYIGAGVGAAVWVTFMLSMEITQAAVLTALLNVLAGSVFLWRYFDQVQWPKTLAVFHLLLLVSLLILAQNGQHWMQQFTNVLYKDQVIYTSQSNYQHIAVTERYLSVDQAPILDLYLNGRLQFSGADEHVYHSMLVYPAMAASRRHDNILLIGGGDGLALRDVLRWEPKQVTLIDLDPELVALFSNNGSDQSHSVKNQINQQMTQLNQHAFDDPRVDVIFGDAFIEITSLISQGLKFDTIIIDLPDPSHPDLNKLYSDFFYARVYKLLQGDGVLVIQSTSPFHAKQAFQSVGKTVDAAGFLHVEQYRQNVPSFGEWGWTIATKAGQSPFNRIKSLGQLPNNQDPWITQPLMIGAFAFPKNFYSNINEIKVNTLGSLVLYQYHYQAWQKDQGLYFKQ